MTRHTMMTPGPVGASGLVLTLVALIALAGPWLAPEDPHVLARLTLEHARLPPGSRDSAGLLHVLGTDDQGRDLLSAILFGLRVSLGVAATGTVLALAVGVVVGVGAAWRGGLTETLAMRAADLQLSFPAILVALMLIAALGQGADKVIVAIAASQWAWHARVLRTTAATEMTRGYIMAARGQGLPGWFIIGHHLLPNCLGTVMVLATSQLATGVTLEATLSFLGLGVPMTRPSLGLLIANGAQYVFAGQYWMSLWPGLVLIGTLVLLQQAGDRLALHLARPGPDA
jgi:peptide/nickel transport system permease protein